MSTRAIIGIKNEDGTFTGSWCWHDGYPEQLGQTIRDNFTSMEQLNELFEKAGTCSSIMTLEEYKDLEDTCKEHGWEMKEPIKLDSVPGVTIVPTEGSNLFDTYKDLMDASAQDVNYVYMFDKDNKEWSYIDYNYSGREDQIYKIPTVEEIEAQRIREELAEDVSYDRLREQIGRFAEENDIVAHFGKNDVELEWHSDMGENIVMYIDFDDCANFKDFADKVKDYGRNYDCDEELKVLMGIGYNYPMTVEEVFKDVDRIDSALSEVESRLMRVDDDITMEKLKDILNGIDDVFADVGSDGDELYVDIGDSFSREYHIDDYDSVSDIASELAGEYMSYDVNDEVREAFGVSQSDGIRGLPDDIRGLIDDKESTKDFINELADKAEEMAEKLERFDGVMTVDNIKPDSGISQFYLNTNNDIIAVETERDSDGEVNCSISIATYNEATGRYNKPEHVVAGDVKLLRMPELGNAIADMGQHANLEDCVKANKALLSERDVYLVDEEIKKDKSRNIEER